MEALTRRDWLAPFPSRASHERRTCYQFSRGRMFQGMATDPCKVCEVGSIPTGSTTVCIIYDALTRLVHHIWSIPV